MPQGAQYVLRKHKNSLSQLVSWGTASTTLHRAVLHTLFIDGQIKLRLNFEFLLSYCSLLHSACLFVGTGACVQIHVRGVRFPAVPTIVFWSTIVLRLSDTSPGSRLTHCCNQLHCSRQLQHFQPGYLSFLHNAVIFSSLSKIFITGSQNFPHKPNLYIHQRLLLFLRLSYFY